MLMRKRERENKLKSVIPQEASIQRRGKGGGKNPLDSIVEFRNSRLFQEFFSGVGALSHFIRLTTVGVYPYATSPYLCG